MIKSYTDIEQSKKLAKILPLESADMHYNNISIKGINYADEHRAELMEYNRAIKVLSKYAINPLFEVIPCWSLAALLNYLCKVDFFPNIEADEHSVIMNISYYNEEEPLAPVYSIKVKADTFVDACYEMILKLHELNL